MNEITKFRPELLWLIWKNPQSPSSDNKLLSTALENIRNRLKEPLNRASLKLLSKLETRIADEIEYQVSVSKYGEPK